MRRGLFWDMRCSQGPIAYEYLTRPTPTRLGSAKRTKRRFRIFNNQCSTVQYCGMMITTVIISSFTGPSPCTAYAYAVLMLPSNTTSFYDSLLHNTSRNHSEVLVCFSCCDARESMQRKKIEVTGKDKRALLEPVGRRRRFWWQ